MGDIDWELMPEENESDVIQIYLELQNTSIGIFYIDTSTLSGKVCDLRVILADMFGLYETDVFLTCQMCKHLKRNIVVKSFIDLEHALFGHSRFAVLRIRKSAEMRILRVLQKRIMKRVKVIETETEFIVANMYFSQINLTIDRIKLQSYIDVHLPPESPLSGFFFTF